MGDKIATEKSSLRVLKVLKKGKYSWVLDPLNYQMWLSLLKKLDVSLLDSLWKSGEGEWIDPVGGGVGGGGDDVKTLNVELQQELFWKLLGAG